MIRLAAWYMEAISAAKLSLNTNGVEKIFDSGLGPQHLPLIYCPVLISCGCEDVDRPIGPKRPALLAKPNGTYFIG